MRRACLAFFVSLTVCLLIAPSAAAQGAKDAFGDALPPGAIARIGTTRFRLANGAYSSALAPDGKLLAVANWWPEIEIWDLPTWTRMRVIKSKKIDPKKGPTFQELAFSADGKKLLAFDAMDQQTHLFDLSTGNSIKTIARSFINPPKLVLSSDEQTLLFLYINQGLRMDCLVWDLTKDRLTRTINIPSELPSGRLYHAVSTDCGKLVLSTSVANQRGSPRSFLEFWDLKTGKLDRKIETEDSMRKLVFSPDGRFVAASTGESILRVYAADTAKEMHSLRLPNDWVRYLAFSSDGTKLYVANHRGDVTCWDPVNGKRTATYPSTNDVLARHYALQADGKVLALRIFPPVVNYWELTSGRSLAPSGLPLVRDLGFSLQGDLFVSSRELAWWNPHTGAKLRDIRLDLSSFGNLLDRLPVHDEDYYREPHFSYMTLSPAGQFLVNMNGSSGGVNIHFFDAANGKLLYTENGGPHGRLRWVCFFDSDRKAASIQGHKVRIWNARTGRDISQFALPMQKEEHALKISVAPDGKYFAFRTDDNPGGTQRIFVWDVEKQKIVREWPASSRSGALDFSPDNQWLAIRTDEKSVRLVRLGSPLADTLLPTGDSRLAPTSLAAFSPDGRQLVLTIMSESNKNSGGIAVYELASKKIRLKLVGHSEFGQFGSIGCLAFAKDSGLLATGAADTTVLVWRAGLSAFATQANKDATDDELARWFQQMAGADAEMAFQKMIKLTQAPRQTVKLFEEKIPPVKKPDSGEKSIPQWIQDLASPNFATRSRASAMLQKLGPSAESDLHAALPKAGDVESRRRIEEHLNRVAAYEWTARDVLHARAVEVLEAIATAEARALLTSWTTGERTAVLTVVAQRALARLKK